MVVEVTTYAVLLVVAEEALVALALLVALLAYLEELVLAT